MENQTLTRREIAEELIVTLDGLTHYDGTEARKKEEELIMSALEKYGQMLTDEYVKVVQAQGLIKGNQTAVTPNDVREFITEAIQAKWEEMK
jgi:hypothetical protein